MNTLPPADAPSISEKPRVCHIISSFSPVIGGAERATEELCRVLIERGGDVRVVTRRQPDTARFAVVSGVPVHRCGLAHPGKLGSLTFALDALLLLAFKLRGYRAVHIQNIDTPLLIGLIAKRVLRRRLLATIHGEMEIQLKEQSALGRARVREMVRRVDVFTAISPNLTRQLEASGAAPTRIREIPNGVDLSRFSAGDPQHRRRIRESLGLSDDTVIVLFVGRLVALKQVDWLLRAWSKAAISQPTELLVIGDGPERNGLEALGAQLSVSHVRYLGAQGSVAPFMRAADIFVLPSRREGLSVALVEAMASGLAPIVTNLPGNRALVEHGVTGCVVPVGDLERLTAVLVELAEDADVRQRLGTEAANFASRTFGLDKVARQHELIYRLASVE